MRAAAFVVAMTGCYAPAAPAGVPCAMTALGPQCPDGQMCVAENGRMLCERGPGTTIDARADGALPGDRDGDGVSDATDNCPDRANADQGNEDGDRFGDVCDPCPPIADDNPPDADGDGVADACDPDSTRADRIVLFEGFHGALPTSWTRTGSWTVASDELAVVAGNDRVATLLPGVTVTDKNRIAASVIVDGVSMTNPDIDVVDPFGTSDGITCALFQATAGTREVSVYDLGAAAAVNSIQVTWTNGTPYTLTLDRTSNQFSCEAKSQSSTARIGVPINEAFSTTAVGLRSHGITARYQWLMVVTSP